MRIVLRREEILALLEGTPERIAAATAGLTAARARTSPRAGEWSLNDILAHLRACADVGGDAIARILAEDHPTLRAVDPRVHVTKTDYPSVDFASSFSDFARQRTRSLGDPSASHADGVGSQRAGARPVENARGERAFVCALARPSGTCALPRDRACGAAGRRQRDFRVK